MLIASSALTQQRNNNLYRQRPCTRPLEKNLMEMEGKFYLNFSSNDYLGLSQDAQVIDALCQAAQTSGVGSTASRMICGHHPAHESLEQAFAEWMGYETAILFSNGYMANLGVFEALSHLNASFCLDKFCHTSLIHGARISQKPMFRYQHNDQASLERQLQNLNQNTLKFLVTEGLFSMEGDTPNLPDLLKLSKVAGAQLILDDAHAIGVLGATGRGSLEHWNLSPSQVPLLILPLGKAFGSYGAVVLTNMDYRELILQFASTYTYTTNIPPAIAAATAASLHIIQTQAWRRESLHTNIHLFQNTAKELGLTIPHLDGPIQVIPAHNNAEALLLHETLKSQGFFAQAIRSPSVPANSPRLRITLNCHHTAEEIRRLLHCIAEGKASC